MPVNTTRDYRLHYNTSQSIFILLLHWMPDNHLLGKMSFRIQSHYTIHCIPVGAVPECTVYCFTCHIISAAREASKRNWVMVKAGRW
jgi:hypothetical protein